WHNCLCLAWHIGPFGTWYGIKQTPGIRATGTITFYNGKFVDQQINAGTMFNLAGGVRIVTDRAVEDIPQASAPPNSHAGVASISAHGNSGGPAGNVAALTTDGSIFAKNLTAFTGGQDPQNVTSVQQRDISGIVTTFLSEVMRMSTGPRRST